MRQLQQSPACACPSEQLGGVSAGGWVALSLFIGMFIGSTMTVLIQCWRRRRELRYMSKGTTVRQSLVMMHALPAPHTPDHATQQLTLPVSSAAAGLSPLPAPASTKGGPTSKYFSPLNTNKGHNSVVAQLAEMRSSMHIGGSDNGGDTHSVAASDQQAPRDKNVTFANQDSTPASQRGREFSQHGMRMQQRSSPGVSAWGSAAQGSAVDSGSQGIVLQGSVVYGAASAMGTQLPQEVSSSILSAEGPLLEEDSSPMSTTQRARTGAGTASSQHAGAPATPASAVRAGAAAVTAPSAPSPRQQAHLAASPVKATAGAAAATRPQAAAPEASVSPAAVRQAGGAASAVSPDGGASSRASKQAASPTPMTEIEDEYEETDLDDDWKALLGGVDARLRLQGARAMNARERAIAIKKLLVATGTRGVEFALNSTLQEVLNFRQLHGH